MSYSVGLAIINLVLIGSVYHSHQLMTFHEFHAPGVDMLEWRFLVELPGIYKAFRHSIPQRNRNSLTDTGTVFDLPQIKSPTTLINKQTNQ